MKNVRLILLALSLVYVVVTLLLMVNEDSLYNNLNLLNLMDYFKWWMTLGLILLVGLMVVGTLYIRSLKKHNRHLEKEYTEIKARLYDIEQARLAEDAEAGRRIEAFRSSLDKTNRPGDGTSPQE